MEMLVSRAYGVVNVQLTSCGMMDSLERRSLSPIAAISMLHNGQLGLRTNVTQLAHPSISIEPDVNSTMRNNASMRDDFPAPVLREESTKLN